MYAVVLDGFKTKEQAEEFVTWYGEAGEQDLYYWFEENMPGVSANLDYTNPPKWNGNCYQATVGIINNDEEKS